MKGAGYLFIAVAGAVLVVWFLLLRPPFLDGPASYVMVAGRSMEPTLSGGDLAVVRQQDTYAPGDIVAFRVPKGEPGEGAIVIHRISGGTAENGFIMQGDNKRYPDPWHPTEDDIMGEMWVSVPGAGRLLGYLRAPLPLATLAGWLALVLVATGGRKTKRPDKTPPVARSG